MRTVNVERMRRHAHRRTTEQVVPETLKVGDRVIIECEVYGRDDYHHVLVRPVRGTLWNCGDQHLWTWERTGVPAKTVERVRT